MDCWVLFLVFWFVNAFAVKRTAERTAWRMRLSYRVPTVLGAFLIFWVNWAPPWNTLLWPHAPDLEAGATTLCILGLVIAVWARVALAGNWSGDVTFKHGHELVQHGPYRFVRHPIYTGLFAMLIATALAEGNLGGLLGAGLIIAGTWFKMRAEEALMLKHFPEAYPEYRSRVKAIMPFLM